MPSEALFFLLSFSLNLEAHGFLFSHTLPQKKKKKNSPVAISKHLQITSQVTKGVRSA